MAIDTLPLHTLSFGHSRLEQVVTPVMHDLYLRSTWFDLSCLWKMPSHWIFSYFYSISEIKFL